MGCDEEALDSVRRLVFSPGVKKGKPVKVQMTMPVTFRMR
jgi:protein TonB